MKATTAKGRRYEYFRTGVLDARGREILKRLPARSDPSFGSVYASLLAGRTRRANVAAELRLPRLVELYEASPEYRALAASSRRTYSIYLSKLSDQLAPAPAGAIEPRDVLLVRDRMATTPGAANGLIRSTRALYAWARKRGHVACDPCAGIELFESSDYEPWPEDLLKAALASDDRGIALPTALLYFTAQRISDTCAIRWSDVRDGRISITQEKTGTPVDFPVHRELAQILANTPKTGLTILANAKGRAARPGTIRDRLQAFAATHGFKVVPHGLRKNAVNALLEAGCSAAETGAISGQSLAIVEHYAKRRSKSRLGNSAVLKWEGGKA